MMLNWIYDCEVVYVMYPYMTFEDGTEVVHSDLITDGDIEKVIVHFERPTVEASTPLAHMTQSAVKSHNGPADRLQSVGGACR